MLRANYTEEEKSLFHQLRYSYPDERFISDNVALLPLPLITDKILSCSLLLFVLMVYCSYEMVVDSLV